MVNLTTRAIAELERLKNHQDSDSDSKYLRIKVSEGGCLEFIYQLDFMAESDQQNLQFTHDSGIVIITDRVSHEQIQNLTIDYLEDLMGGAFQFKNPDITHHCTCGLSFSIDS